MFIGFLVTINHCRKYIFYLCSLNVDTKLKINTTVKFQDFTNDAFPAGGHLEF